MSKHETNAEKRSVLADLDFDPTTAKRASWEAFSFRVLAEHQIEVANESYDDVADHTYTVTVEQKRDGRVIPIHCTCPYDQHNPDACKHRIACATRTIVLGAAAVYTADWNPDDAVVLADGGHIVTDDAAPTDTGTEDTDADGDGADKPGCNTNWCPGPRDDPSDDLPCFDCFRSLADDV